MLKYACVGANLRHEDQHLATILPENGYQKVAKELSHIPTR